MRLAIEFVAENCPCHAGRLVDTQDPAEWLLPSIADPLPTACLGQTTGRPTPQPAIARRLGLVVSELGCRARVLALHPLDESGARVEETTLAGQHGSAWLFSPPAPFDASMVWTGLMRSDNARPERLGRAANRSAVYVNWPRWHGLGRFGTEMMLDARGTTRQRNHSMIY